MTAPTPNKKTPLTYEAQLNLLQQRGMKINDRNRAIRMLRHHDFYRLSAFWQDLVDSNAGDEHRFLEGSGIEQVMDFYDFDHQLANMIFVSIKEIEISVKATWAYHFAHEHGPIEYQNPELALNMDMFSANMRTF